MAASVRERPLLVRYWVHCGKLLVVLFDLFPDHASWCQPWVLYQLYFFRCDHGWNRHDFCRDATTLVRWVVSESDDAFLVDPLDIVDFANKVRFRSSPVGSVARRLIPCIIQLRPNYGLLELCLYAHILGYLLQAGVTRVLKSPLELGFRVIADV